MSKQTINIGTVANDGTGDNIRVAMDKSNDNFTEVYDGKVSLDQTTPQTIINGIPLLESTREITEDNQLVDKLYADTVQSGGMKSFFFTKTASDVNGMYVAQTDLPTALAEDITVTVADPFGTPTIVAKFITPVAVSDYRVIDGSRFFYFKALTSVSARNVQLRGKIYTCALDGSNPVLLRTSNWTAILTQVFAEYDTYVWGNSLNIDHTTTRIIFEIEAKKINNNNPDPTITIQVNDDTFSRLDVPSPTGSIDISGLVPYTGATTDVTLGAHTINTLGLVLPKTTGTGIKIDQSTPTFGWKDMQGQLVPHVGGGISPTSTLIKGSGTHMRAWAFSGGDVLDSIIFHIPHDYVAGTDVYIHTHWQHAGTSISGNFVMTWYTNYAKGYTQAGQVFGNEITIVQTVPTANIATYPQYAHNISEFQLSNSGGDATHLNTLLLEPDGIINVAMVATTIPTINGNPGGSVNEPFIMIIDLHYQSTQVATKNKNYPFYT